MADQKITQLTELTTPVAADLLAIVDDPSGTPVTKKVTIANLLTAMKLDDLAAPDDNTDLNASTSAHGLLLKLNNVVTDFLNGQGGWSAPAGGNPIQIVSSRRSSGNVVTTSTSFIDMDATNLAVTMTTTGGDVLVIVSCGGNNNTAGLACHISIDVDGTLEGGTEGILFPATQGTSEAVNLSFSILVTGLSSASHTFKIKIKVQGGTGTFYASSGAHTQIVAIELKD